jgi:hypothetical protein
VIFDFDAVPLPRRRTAWYLVLVATRFCSAKKDTLEKCGLWRLMLDLFSAASVGTMLSVVGAWIDHS